MIFNQSLGVHFQLSLVFIILLQREEKNKNSSSLGKPVKLTAI